VFNGPGSEWATYERAQPSVAWIVHHEHGRLVVASSKIPSGETSFVAFSRIAPKFRISQNLLSVVMAGDDESA
jgi:hypothetical protein